MMQKKSLLYSLFFLNILIWGSSWASVRFLLERYTQIVGSPTSKPFFIAGLRYVLAGFIIFPFAIKSIREKPLTKKDILSLFCYALFFIALSNALVFWSQQFLPSSLCSIIFSLYPMLILVLSFLFLQDETIHLLKILGTFVSFLGVVLIFFDPLILEIPIGSLAFFSMVLSVFFAAFPTVLIRKYSIHLNVLVLNSLGMLLGGVFLLITAFIVESPLQLPKDLPFWLVLLYLSAFASCYTLIAFFWLMRHVQLTKLSLSSYLTPLVSLIIGVLFYNESLNIQSYLGMLFIFLGISLIDAKKYRMMLYGK